MDVLLTVTKPWREPVDYLTLVFWFIIFIVAAFAMWDSMRVLTKWIGEAAADVAKG